MNAIQVIFEFIITERRKKISRDICVGKERTFNIYEFVGFMVRLIDSWAGRGYTAKHKSP